MRLTFPLWSWGFGEWRVGGHVGGTRLYSPVSGSLAIVNLLACFQGMGGEINASSVEGLVSGSLGDALGGHVCTHQCWDY